MLASESNTCEVVGVSLSNLLSLYQRLPRQIEAAVAIGVSHCRPEKGGGVLEW